MSDRMRIAHVYPHAVRALPGQPAVRRLLPEATIGLHVHDHALADFSPAWGRTCLHAVDFAVTCSDFVTERMRRRLGGGLPPIHTLHNGVDPRFFACDAQPGESRRIVFVGRLAPEKGVHLLIEAFSRVAPRFPDATLDLIGPSDISPPEFVDPRHEDPVLVPLGPWLARPGTYRKELQRRAAGLGGRIRFLGPVDNARLPALLRGAGLLAMPSLWHEPFGIPVVEAMAAGLPVVASDAGAFPETVLPERTGLLVPRGDGEALAGTLARLLADGELRKRLGAAGRARAAECFTWQGRVETLETIYGEALELRARETGGATGRRGSLAASSG